MDSIIIEEAPFEVGFREVGVVSTVSVSRRVVSGNLKDHSTTKTAVHADNIIANLRMRKGFRTVGFAGISVPNTIYPSDKDVKKVTAAVVFLLTVEGKPSKGSVWNTVTFPDTIKGIDTAPETELRTI